MFGCYDILLTNLFTNKLQSTTNKMTKTALPKYITEFSRSNMECVDLRIKLQ